MRFVNPEAFLLFIPVFFLFLFNILKEKKRISLLTDNFSLRNLKNMGLDTQMSTRGLLARVCYFLFLSCVVVALTRPQSGQDERDEVTSEHSIIFLIDLSRSMLAKDVSPSRLDLTKKEIASALKTLDGVRVGLVAFAGSAAVISPMTADLSALEMYLDSLSTSTIGSQGTEVFAALEESKAMFNRITKKEGLNKSGEKVIVLFSDGENHQESSLNMVKEMSKNGFRIFSVAVGTESGGYIPEFEGAREYIKMGDGQLVVSKPNYSFMRKIAKAGRGSFYTLSPLDPFSLKLKKDLEKIESVNNSKRKFIVKNDAFQIPLFFGFIFLCFYLALRRRK